MRVAKFFATIVAAMGFIGSIGYLAYLHQWVILGGECVLGFIAYLEASKWFNNENG